MAKIVSFVVCDLINNMPADNMGVIPSIVAPQIALRPQVIPSNFSFGIAVGIADMNLQITNKVRFTVADPDGNIVHDSGESDLPAAPEMDTLPQQYQGFMMCIDIRNLLVQSEGAFTFSFYLNNDCIGVQRVPVYKRATK